MSFVTGSVWPRLSTPLSLRDTNTPTHAYTLVEEGTWSMCTCPAGSVAPGTYSTHNILYSTLYTVPQVTCSARQWQAQLISDRHLLSSEWPLSQGGAKPQAITVLDYAHTSDSGNVSHPHQLLALLSQDSCIITQQPSPDVWLSLIHKTKHLTHIHTKHIICHISRLLCWNGNRKKETDNRCNEYKYKEVIAAVSLNTVISTHHLSKTRALQTVSHQPN